MRLKILFRPQERMLRLPLNYQHILQGFIYRHIGDAYLARFLHDQGFRAGNRSRKFKSMKKAQKSQGVLTPAH